MGFPLMDRSVYEAMAEHDERHWWYRARREVVAALIRRKVTLPKDAQLLEIGCGTGHNLAMLGEFGSVDALEVDAIARELAEERLGHKVLSSPLPELKGVPSDRYDMVAALDVVEHISDDRAALEGIARVLKPGGKLLVTAPAHQWMWSAHDVVNHHQRRYSKAALTRLFEQSPLKLESIGYLNSLLFPVAMAERLASKLRGKDDANLAPPAEPINQALERIFALERRVIGRVPLPPGLSLFAVASAT
ncbi:class I SAM-dependent methyltransferase [Sphingomonas daechungensis]|uniref:class I SAM-dependent methyltransferase n=1 Tax=Sphingomonas daechungensis TaxID=1176646 RepID=UPI00378349CA